MMPHEFQVGDMVSFNVDEPKYASNFAWDRRRYHNLDTEGNVFRVISLHGDQIRIEGFRGFSGHWQAYLFVSAGPELTPEQRILQRIQKLYKKCKATAHWEVNCG